MFCSNCGKRIAESSKFCKFCGYDMEEGISNSEKTFEAIKLIIKDKKIDDIKTKKFTFLVIVLLIIFVICNFVPVVRTESYIGQENYNIISFTKNILYSDYKFICNGKSCGHEPHIWNDMGHTTSIFGYMHGKSIHLGDQSYGEDIEMFTWFMYMFSLIIMSLNIFFVIVISMKLIKRQFFSKRLLNTIFLLEIIRVGILNYIIRFIIETVPEVFKHKNFYVGDYEIATTTICPFYVATIIVMLILEIIYYILFKHSNN